MAIFSATFAADWLVNRGGAFIATAAEAIHRSGMLFVVMMLPDIVMAISCWCQVYATRHSTALVVAVLAHHL